jgi:drug/metabolite transporter (DMT)-like permease
LPRDSSNPSRPSGALLAAGVAFISAAWVGNFFVGKMGLRTVPPLRLLAFRLEIAGLVSIPLYLSRPKRPAMGVGGPVRKKTLLDIWTLIYLGFFGVVVNMGGYVIGLNYTTVGHAGLITGLGPVFILLLAWSQGLESLLPLSAFGVVFAFAGAGILSAEHSVEFRSGTLRGDLITLAGTLGFALYTVLGKRVARKYSPSEMNAYNYFVGALFFLPYAIHQAIFLTRTGAWGTIKWTGWAAIVYMALISAVAAYLIYFWALRYVAASRLSAILYVNPVAIAVLGVWLLHDPVTWNLVAGGTLVLVGIYTIEAGHRRNAKSQVVYYKNSA